MVLNGIDIFLAYYYIVPVGVCGQIWELITKKYIFVVKNTPMCERERRLNLIK